MKRGHPEKTGLSHNLGKHWKISEKSKRRMNENNPIRKCSKCKKELPRCEFHRQSEKRSGLNSYCKKCATINLRKWVKENPKKNYERSKRYIDKFPLRQKARLILGACVKIGKIKKENCRDCNSKKSVAHHPDWNKPLEVIWLCPKHHMAEHRKINQTNK